MTPGSLTEGLFSPAQVSQVLDLVAAAEAADGVAPLSEQVLLHVRHGGSGTASAGRDVLVAAGGLVVGYAHLDPPDEEAQAGDMSGELVVHPAHRRQRYGTALVAALAGQAGGPRASGGGVLERPTAPGGHGTPGGHGIRIWAHGDRPAAAAFARSTGFTRFRELWQMLLPLADASLPEPALPAGVTLRTFRPGADEDAWLAVNRRAFAHHPEQSGWTAEDLSLREAEPWFDPAGFFLAERDGRLIGFHWTKVHPAGAPGGGPIGEVYVVGVDPDGQGGGLGRALTLAGLLHLRDRGLDEVMLYVDGDNTPAIRLYTGLGFGQWHTDVMYRRA
jgi:mycothiol synthase